MSHRSNRVVRPISVGLLHIGQSQPAKDEDFSHLGVEVIDFNPLDEYSVNEILQKLKPIPGELPISSSTVTGERILISKSALVPELNKTIAQAEARGIARAAVTCTGDFDLSSSTKLEILFPGELLKEAVSRRAWTEGEKVAVLVPVDEQKPFLTDRWVQRLPKVISVSAFTLSPAATISECRALAEDLLNKGYSAAILDCMGYLVSFGETVKRTGLDVYLAKGVTINALLGK